MMRAVIQNSENQTKKWLKGSQIRLSDHMLQRYFHKSTERGSFMTKRCNLLLVLLQ
jgi:hypothetical protein